ncbi:hypothetical protein AV650_15705 [Serratia fonticola]|nr:hypothetical protein AV650_15705 [Serratia fonticola]
MSDEIISFQFNGIGTVTTQGVAYTGMMVIFHETGVEIRSDIWGEQPVTLVSGLVREKFYLDSYPAGINDETGQATFYGPNGIAL